MNESLRGDVFDMLALPQRDGWDAAQQLSYLFKGISQRSDAVGSIDGWVREMDRCGVRTVLLSIMDDSDLPWVRQAVGRFPDRFVGGLVVNPANGMDEIHRISRYVREHGIKLLRLGPWRIGKAPTHRIYWPIYTKAIELGVPVQINVGIPGPKVPGWNQDPIYIDEVCYEFPDLTVIMTHVGYPWVGTVARNLVRWDNCYLAMNSYAPRLWPPELVELMRGRAAHKFIYATEFPLLGWDRTLAEIDDLELPQDVLELFLAGNARRLLNEEKRVATGTG